MKKIVITSLLSAFAMAANAAPLVTIGDQMDIFFNGAVMGNYNTNVTYANKSDKKIDDFAGTLRLGAEADYGRSSKFKANLKFFEDFTKYVDHKELDNNLAHIVAKASYEEATWNVKAHFSFDQNRQNTADTAVGGVGDNGELVTFNKWIAGVNGSYDFTEKVYGTIGFEFFENDYTHGWNQRYSSFNMYSVPVSVLYRVTQKVAVGLSYQYRYTDYYDGPKNGLGDNRTDNFVGVTVMGEIAPKLTCEAYVGGQNRSYTSMVSGTSDDWTVAANAKLGYEVSEKMGVYVKALRDFGNSAARYSTRITSCEGGVNYYFNPKVVATASMAYVDTDYDATDRDDKTIWTRLGVSYVPNKFVTLGINYNYLNNESNVVDACYNQHIVSFNAMLKY